MVEGFIEYQRRMWQFIARFGVCRYFIDVNKKGRYVIRKHPVGYYLFWILWTNNLSKVIYHLLTYHSLLGIKVGFLDQMNIWEWISIYSHLFFECMVWFFKYPMWEYLYMQWELQEDIYRKLGRPESTANKINYTDRLNFVLYGGICMIGTLSLGIQFFFTPKYVLNTYAIVPFDNLPLRIIFMLHECLFICHGYAYQAFTMVLAESYAVSYLHLLEDMNKCLQHFISEGKKIRAKPRASKNPSTLQPKILDPKMLAPDTEYNIHSLLSDYKKVMISAQFHNQWIGRVMGFAEGVNYIQFVGDVFIMIQVLKEPGSSIGDVFFYGLDAAFGMIMIFRMLIILSRLYTQGEEFVHGIKDYTSMNTPLRRELIKTLPTLRIVSAKLTGCTIKPETVPVGVAELINWYIAAAMWQRPDDPSRRT